MDIIIKSFNRPYYLDRCIQSIYKNVVDSDFAIKILDDGTPEEYLIRLTEKYPEIQIYKSEFYKEKSAEITNGFTDSEYAPMSKIPINLWIEAAQNATDYFLLLEDDIWLTQKIDLNKTESALKSKNVFFLKLFWLGNPKLIKGSVLERNDFFTVYKPDVYTQNPLLFRIVFKMTRFKIRAVMALLSLYNKERALAYYSIYSVAGVIFKKEYFLNLWSNHTNLVDEYLQLHNAVKFWKKNKDIQFARTNSEVLATGFFSSATNKIHPEVKLDVFALNNVLNKAWFKGELDAMEGFPKDLNQKKIAEILEKECHPLAQTTEWEKWVIRFKKQFTLIGCNID